MPDDVRPILTFCLYGGGRIHKAAAIKMGEHSPTGGMIRRAQVGKMNFGTSVLVGFERILPSRACFASTVGAACAVGGSISWRAKSKKE